LSHKTGKRVLTASTTIALAAVGLAAAPLAAHAAAADVTLTNVCGGAGLDYVTLPANTGIYTFKAAGDSAVDLTVDTSDATIGGANTAGANAATATLSADQATYKVTLSDELYDAATGKAVTAFAVYDESGAKASLGTFDNATCAVSSVPSLTSDPAKKTITVTKGTGIDWVVSIADGTNAADTTVTTSGLFVLPDAEVDATGKILSNLTTGPASAVLKWSATDGPLATQTLTVAGAVGTELVTVTAKPSPGYTGVDVVKSYKMDSRSQVSFVQPTKQDRDGIESDTLTLPNIQGVTWFYSTKDVGSAPGGTATAGNTSLGVYTAPTITGGTAGDWNKVTFQSGETQAVITRPKDNASGKIFWQAVLTDMSKYKWDAVNTSGATVESGAATFQDTTAIKSLPAPEMVNADGANDYYVLPKVPGVTWTVVGGGNTTTYTSDNPLLGTRIPVYTYGQVNPVEYTFTASISVADQARYAWDPAVTLKQWKQEYDSRTSITPAAPSFVDQTGIFEDAVTFPQLQTGMTSYKIALSDTAVPTTATQYVDGSWYGKTIKLTDLQRTLAGGDIAFVHVLIVAEPNDSLYVVTKGADGNPVKSSWSYSFTNTVVIVPQAPVQSDQAGSANDTLTFPMDPRVTYKTVQNGITRTIAYSDLGKPLPYTGRVTVIAEAATGYLLQPKPDGTAPDPWIFTFTSETDVTPQAPTQDDQENVANDTYTLPDQAGVIWMVDGVEMAAGTHSTEGKSSVTITAEPADGTTFADGAKTSWTFTYGGMPATPEVSNEIVADANVPTAKIDWSSDSASSYKVTFQKLLGNGQRGPELTWFADTEATTANFVAMEGDKYYIRVVAMNDNGESEAAETLVSFSGQRGYVDIAPGEGTFGGSWDHLTNLLKAQNLPYWDDTAALGYNNSSFTVTLPEGSRSFDLYATVHQYGSKGKITVNGVNWADFDTNSAKWGAVTDPYMYPVRSVSGWDPTAAAWKTVTIKVTIVDPDPMHYVALDAYEAR